MVVYKKKYTETPFTINLLFWEDKKKCKNDVNVLSNHLQNEFIYSTIFCLNQFDI